MGRESGNGFTPTEQRIIDVLKEGVPRTKYELMNAIDEQADDNTLAVHIHNIRKKLERQSWGIMCTERGGVRYQLVRMLAPPHDSSYGDMTNKGHSGI